ncbi:MAG: exodeoxyribonuclease VII large subunit [Desertifilum sp. SIO1I2]|nr:exodeoxyribonuclease VII large subunit [Desertifilum sp. SIO1I2]
MTSHLPNLLVPETAVSVAGLTASIQTLLEQEETLQQVWVTGEVSSASRYPSGLFFTLQDPEGKAALSCVAWNTSVHKLFKQPVSGEQIVVLGSIRVYPPRGQYQLIVSQALPGGEGLQALRYRQIRDRLAAEGLFDPQRKRPLPAHPTVVAAITSPQAAAWGDIQRTLKRRYPGLKVLFSPALVQGSQAPESLVAAIERVKRDGRAQVLIVARGGGATEDLACFNDERVVRAIADSPIPVIAGIGHQRDETLADLVADVCVPTPTAAAVQAVPELAMLEAEFQELKESLHFAMQHRLEQDRDRLRSLRYRLRRLQVDRQIQQEINALTWKRHQLIQLSNQQLQNATQHCEHLQQKLATLDPRRILQRGYAIVRQSQGNLVRSSSELQLEQELVVELGQGQVTVKVTGLSNSSNRDILNT